MAESFEETITLAPGESVPVSFRLRPLVAKTYSVRVNGLSGSFTATAAPPPPVADIVVTDLVIRPSVVGVGEEVSISVTATNIGGASGSKTITLTVT